MPPETHHLPRRDRWTLLWLGLGAGLLVVADGRWIVPLAAWVSPVFLLRFVRTQKLAWAFLGYFPVCCAASAVAWLGIVPLPPRSYFVFIAFWVLLAFLPYLLDRLVAPRLAGLLSTLVFPVAWTSVEYVRSLLSPFGTFGSLGYTQSDNLALLQLASVTGLWGISFLVVWLASVVNWSWKEQFAWERIRGGVSLYALLLGLILLGGGARLALTPRTPATVRVASFTGFDRRATWLPRDPSDLPQFSAQIQEDYLARTEREARAGAKIITWPEVAVPVAEKEEATFIERGRQLARQEQIYLLMPLHTYRNPQELWENKVVLLSPEGEAVWEYVKSEIPPGDRDVRGDGRLRASDTPYGRLTAAICYDMDFPRRIRQAGRARSDILLAPSLDWKTMAPLHARMAIFRAVENGFSLVRQASNGLSLAVDYQGRVLAAMDHFSTGDRVLIAHVPIQGVATLYARIGDAFAWLCLAGFLAFLGWRLLGGRRG